MTAATLTTPAPRLGADAIEALTPVTRNRYADLLRLVAITTVVVGHWLAAVVTEDAGRLRGTSVLVEVPATQLLTWVIQVMPLFFFVGGYANAAAWSAAARRGDTWAEWIRGRATRLLRPVVPLLAVFAAVAVALGAAGVDPGLIRLATGSGIVPLWFLAVYLVVVAVTPLTLEASRRAGWGAVAATAGLAAGADVLARWGAPAAGVTNFAWVWLFPVLAGHLWWDGRMPRDTRRLALVAAGGLATLVALVTLAGYPVSMVGVDGAARSNNMPPSVALVALATVQIGVALLLRPFAERLLRRPRVWAGVVAAGSVTMTVYLWHLPALVALSAGMLVTGTLPQGPVDAGWWAQRPLWIAALTAVLAVLVGIFGRFERPAFRAAAQRSAEAAGRRGGGSAATLSTAAGVVSVAGGLAVLVLRGLPVPGTAWLLSAFALVAVTSGLAGLGVPRRRSGSVSPTPAGPGRVRRRRARRS